MKLPGASYSKASQMLFLMSYHNINTFNDLMTFKAVVQSKNEQYQGAIFRPYFILIYEK